MAQAADRATPKIAGKAAGKASSKSTPGSAGRSTAGSSSNGSAPARATKTTPVTAQTTSAQTTSAQSTAGSGIGNQLLGFADRFGLTRLVQPMMGGQSAAGTTGAAGAKKQRSGSFKFLLGMMIFIFSAEFLVYLLTFLDRSVFKGALEATQIGNVPLLGKISPFFLIYILLTLGLWMALYRFNIIPKDPFGVKAQQAARSANNGTNGRSATATVGRNRAARTTASAKETSSSRRAVTGPNDAVYQRVKAAQRSRKRRDAKR